LQRTNLSNLSAPVILNLRRLRVSVNILARGLPVDNQAAALGRRHEPRNVGADELNHAVLEPRVHDGLLPLDRQVVWQGAGLVKIDDLDAGPPLALCDGLGPGHEALVVKGQHDRRAAVEEKVAHDGGGELGVDEISPRQDALRLHEFDLPVDEASTDRCGQLPVLKRLRRLGAQELHPFRVDCHCGRIKAEGVGETKMDQEEKEKLLHEIGDIRALLQTLKPVDGPVTLGPASSKRVLNLF